MVFRREEGHILAQNPALLCPFFLWFKVFYGSRKVRRSLEAFLESLR